MVMTAWLLLFPRQFFFHTVFWLAIVRDAIGVVLDWERADDINYRYGDQVQSTLSLMP